MNLDKLIIEKMDPLWTDIEKARFIYLELAKIVNFDTTFNNSGILGYAYLRNAKVSIYNLETSQVNCRMWAQLYSQLLYRANIANRIVDNNHQHVLFEIDGKTFAADATCGVPTDLSRIKNHELTQSFSPWPHGFNSDKPFYNTGFNQEWINELNEIDNKVRSDLKEVEALKAIKDSFNIIRDDKEKSNTSIDTSEIEQKLDVLFSAVGKMKDGYYESKDFIYSLERELFTSDELSIIKSVELKRVNKSERVDIIQCIYINSSNPKYYLLGQNNNVIKVSKKQLEEFKKVGFSISKDKKQIPGVSIKNSFAFKKSNKFKMVNFINRIKGRIYIEHKMRDETLDNFVKTSSLEYNDENVFGFRK